MSVITFWSNNKKAIGQSVAAALATTMMAMEHNYKCLVLSTQYEDNAYEKAFGVTAHTKSFLRNILKGKDTGLDSGIEGLTKMAISNRLSPELIPNYTKVAIKTLEVLTGPKKIDDTTDYDKILKGFQLEDGFIQADELEYVKDGKRKEIGIEIHSGRNRIVRRIFEHLGYKVEKLDRVYFAGLTKYNLPRGRWRHLTEQEVNALKMGAFE